MHRPLSAEEEALWAKVIATVRPLRAVMTPAVAAVAPGPAAPPEKLPKAPAVAARPVAPPPKPRPGVTLDGSWDKRLATGAVRPDVTVDLHGHNLATAYDLLDTRLEQAIAMGDRVLLLITGKPPRGEPPIARGRIRAAVGDWLAASRHAGAIAAIRAAHPRHGGAGALYIILRRPR